MLGQGRQLGICNHTLIGEVLTFGDIVGLDSMMHFQTSSTTAQGQLLDVLDKVFIKNNLIECFVIWEARLSPPLCSSNIVRDSPVNTLVIQVSGIPGVDVSSVMDCG